MKGYFKSAGFYSVFGINYCFCSMFFAISNQPQNKNGSKNGRYDNLNKSVFTANPFKLSKRTLYQILFIQTAKLYY